MGLIVLNYVVSFPTFDSVDNYSSLVVCLDGFSHSHCCCYAA